MTLKPFVLNQTDLEFILAQLEFVPLFDANGDAVARARFMAPRVPCFGIRRLLARSRTME
jgi:hypothetical protein